MNSYTITDDKQIDTAREIFSDLNAMNDVLVEAANTGIEAALAPAELYAFALGTAGPNGAKVEAALRANAPIRAAFQDLLARVSEYHVPRAMAAASDDIAVRDGVDCKISIQPSQAAPDQVYVIVELTRASSRLPKVMHLMGAGNVYDRAELPELAVIDDAILGTDTLIGRETEKLSAGAKTGAATIDMESHRIAMVAEANGLPMIIVRAVLDDVHTELPALVKSAVTAEGTPDYAKVITGALLKPWNIKKLARLAKLNRAAHRTLRRVAPILGGVLKA